MFVNITKEPRILGIIGLFHFHVSKSNAWTARGNRTRDWLYIFTSFSLHFLLSHTTTQHNTTHKFSYWIIIIISYQFSFTLFSNKKRKRKRNMTTATFVDIILAILLPPLGVFLRFGCEVPTSFIFFISFHFIFFFLFLFIFHVVDY